MRMGRKTVRHLIFGALVLFFAVGLVPAAGALDVSNDIPRAVGPAYVPNQVLVTLQPGRTEADLAGLCTEYGCSVARRPVYGSRTYALELPGAGTPVDAFMSNESQILGKYARIQGLDRNYYRYVLDTPNDEYYPTIVNPLYPDFLEGQWQLRPDMHIFAPEGWDLQKGSEDIVVAVIDTGVRDRTEVNDEGKIVRIIHPDLQGRVLYGMDIAEMPDDYDPSPSETPAVSGNATHGTHVAGTIAAQADNWIGIAGLCWDNVQILPIKVFKDNGTATGLDVVYGIYYAMSWRGGTTSSGEPQTVNVINLSLGANRPMDLEYSVIRQAVRKGIVVVAAAGNSWDIGAYAPMYPAGYPEVICVGATDYDDLPTEFSNRGHAVDIAAPGMGVLSTTWYRMYATVDTETGDEGDDGGDTPPAPSSTNATEWPQPDPMPTWPDKYGNTYSYMSGTSMSAPHVAAAAALLLSHGVPPNDVPKILCETATPKGIGRPNDAYGWGLLNVAEALKKASIDVQIAAPAKGGVVTTARPRFRIDFRHALQDSIRVWIDPIDNDEDGIPDNAPTMGGPDPEIADWTKYLYTLDEEAGKTYLLFEHPVIPERAVNGLHKIYVTADSDVEFEQPPPVPLIDEDTAEFKVVPQKLGSGWMLFSIPYRLDEPMKPEEVLGSIGTLARWHYTNSLYGGYAMYSLDGSRTDEESTLTPLGVLGNALVHPFGWFDATPPAGLGYWLHLPSWADVPLPEGYGNPVHEWPYVIGLYYGWNMVGNPFPFPVAWSNVVVEYAGMRLSAEEAVAQGWLSGAFFRYDSVYRRYTWQSVNSAVMRPWEAQWVKVKKRTPELAPTTLDAWWDEFNDGVLDHAGPEPDWSVGTTYGSAIETGGMLRLVGTSGQASNVFVANTEYPIYSDFIIDARLYLANADATVPGAASNAEIRFRADASGQGYSLCFKANDSPDVISLRRGDTGEVIQEKQVNYSLASGTILYSTIMCVGTRIKVRVGTLPGRGDVADWELIDSIFTEPGSFWLLNDGMLDCRWDYFRYRPISLRPPDIKLIVPPNPYSGVVQ